MRYWSFLCVLFFLGFSNKAFAQADLTVQNATQTLGGIQTFGNVVLQNNGRINVLPYNGNPATSGFLHLKATSITIDATSSIVADFAGFRGQTNARGEGPGGGPGGNTAQDSGGGGGYGGIGGFSVRDANCVRESDGGPVYGTANGLEIQMGSAGGAAGSLDGDAGGVGGHGGGLIILEAQTITILGTLSANGQPGANFSNDAAGGGSGGGILLLADTLTVSGTIRANGGQGASADDKGGGGGGGRIKYAYRVGTIGGLLEAKGAAAQGCAGAGANGTVERVNRPPTITSNPPTTAIEDQIYQTTITATDPDGQPLAYRLKQAPPGATIDPVTGEIRWTPGDADAGKTFDFEVEVCDNATPPACVSQAWQVTVQNVNDPPTITSTPPASATEDQSYNYKPTATDPDPGDTQTWRLVKAPIGATMNPATGEILWTPGDLHGGRDVDFEIEVCDAAGACVRQTWKVPVQNVNDPPTLQGTPPTKAYVGEKATYQPQVVDPDPGDTFTWTLKKGPQGATVDPTTGAFEWTPGPADSDTEVEIEIEVCDAAGRCVSQTFKLTPRTRCKVDSDCPTDQICASTSDGLLCIPAGCAKETPKCPVQGDFCKDSLCKSAPCQGVTCPADAICRPSDGTCIKACGPTTCPAGQICDGGACKADPCALAPCKAGEICDATVTPALCKPDPCGAQSCRHGRICVQGLCQDDPCPSMVCPNPFDRCFAGQCGPQPCKRDKECPGSLVCIGDLCQEAGCYLQPCSQGKLCLQGKCVDDPCAAITCAANFVCRPQDGSCIELCSFCPTGQRCVQGACVPDGCPVCDPNSICENGECLSVDCFHPTAPSCKHNRTCSTDRCQDDLCLGLTCPGGRVCRFGVCYLPPSTEPVAESTAEVRPEGSNDQGEAASEGPSDRSEAPAETSAENAESTSDRSEGANEAIKDGASEGLPDPSEASGEARPEEASESLKEATEATPETPGLEGGTEQGNKESGTTGDKAVSESFQGLVSGGCGCSGTPGSPSSFVFFFLLLVFLGFQRRGKGEKRETRL